MVTKKDASYWIEHLKMEKHPEGGYFASAFSSDESWSKECLPSRYKGSRVLYSSIYYLLECSEVCCLHKLATDELWSYYAGGSLRLHLFEANNKYSFKDMGSNIDEGQTLHFKVNRGVDFGGEVINGDYVLAGCVLSPGFSFDDHSWSDASTLIKAFSEHKSLISRLIRA